jgi:hypothetical protein
MMLALDQAGARYSQSPVTADKGNGDETSMRPIVPEPLVTIARFSKIVAQKHGPGAGVSHELRQQSGPSVHLRLTVQEAERSFQRPRAFTAIMTESGASIP